MLVRPGYSRLKLNRINVCVNFSFIHSYHNLWYYKAADAVLVRPGKIKIKRQNKCARNMLFACSRDNAVPYLNLLGISVTLENIYKFKITLFSNKITDKVTSLPTIFKGTLTLAYEVHSYNTRFASNFNFHRLRVRNYRKATVAFAGCKIWEKTQSQFQKPPA